LTRPQDTTPFEVFKDSADANKTGYGQQTRRDTMVKVRNGQQDRQPQQAERPGQGQITLNAVSNSSVETDKKGRDREIRHWDMVVKETRGVVRKDHHDRYTQQFAWQGPG
jgi:hypothetical protein